MCVFLSRVAAVAAGWTLPVALHHKLGKKNSFMDWLIIWMTDCFIIWLIDSFICLHLFTQSVFISQNIIFCPSQNKQDQKGHFPLTRTGWRTDNCFFLLSGMELFNGLFLVSLLCSILCKAWGVSLPLSSNSPLASLDDEISVSWISATYSENKVTQNKYAGSLYAQFFFATMKCSLILSYNTLK